MRIGPLVERVREARREDNETRRNVDACWVCHRVLDANGDGHAPECETREATR
jgi:Mg2+ and Co2+ transporter CorA